MDDEYRNKSIEYTYYLSQRGYHEKGFEKTFKIYPSLSIIVARKTVVKNNKDSRVVFTASYNPRGPDVSKILKEHLHIVENKPELAALFPKGTIKVANKRENNLGYLLLRSDSYNISSDATSELELGYIRYNKKCDSCNNFVDQTTSITSYATGRNFTIRKEITCTSRNVISLVYCKLCGKQGVGSTVAWKPHLAKYKSHI